MCYKNYEDYNEMDKFLDNLFREDASFEWSCEHPHDEMSPSMNITVVKKEGEAEVTYIKSIISEFSEKFNEILDKCESLPDERQAHTFSFTKSELISRLISMSNQLDDIISDIDTHSTGSTTTTTIIGGGPCGSLSLGTPMF